MKKATWYYVVTVDPVTHKERRVHSRHRKVEAANKAQMALRCRSGILNLRVIATGYDPQNPVFHG